MRAVLALVASVVVACAEVADQRETPATVSSGADGDLPLPTALWQRRHRRTSARHRRVDQQGRAGRHRRGRADRPAVRERGQLFRPRRARTEPRVRQPRPGPALRGGDGPGVRFHAGSRAGHQGARLRRRREYRHSRRGDLPDPEPSVHGGWERAPSRSGPRPTSRSSPLSLGDVEPGDVDRDGDLDLVLADWGPGNNMTNEGGRTRLWLNDGTGRFTDATDGRMPATLVRFSWDLELVDVDNDFDLDVLVSCKRCAGSLLFRNDGTGTFEEDPRGLPQYTNNYEFEAMDLDGDKFPRPRDHQRWRDRRRTRLPPARTRLPQRRRGPVRGCHGGLVAHLGEHRGGRQRRGLPGLRFRRRRRLPDRLSERARPPADQRRIWPVARAARGHGRVHRRGDTRHARHGHRRPGR